MSQALVLEKRPFNLRLKWLKYFAVLKVNFLSNTAYIMDVLSISAMVFFRVWLFSQLYGRVFTQTHSTVIGGLSLAQTLWSLALAQCFISSNRTRIIIRDITEEIISGNIANSVSKPYNFITYYYFHGLGHVAANLFSSVFFISLTCLVLVGPIHFSLSALAAGSLLFILGCTINILMCVFLGLAGFWTEETNSLQRIYQKTQLVFGGVILPLSLFPESLKNIAEVLPFGLPYQAPARILVQFNNQLFLKLLVFQVFWILVLITINHLVFKKGIKNVTVNGG